jgi:L-lactate dehydrogenase complex protein LldG
MTSREAILKNVQSRQPQKLALPDIPLFSSKDMEVVSRFVSTLVGIGGAVLNVSHSKEIEDYVKQNFSETAYIINTVDSLNIQSTLHPADDRPQSLEPTMLAIVKGEFAVAESGAIWISNAHLPDHALPFITQTLILIVPLEEIVPTLQEAYMRLEHQVYSFGTFIAGPSKTADIEQSLVLGAHGPKSLTVFLTSL